jgi:hypothetical protein
LKGGREQPVKIPHRWWVFDTLNPIWRMPVGYRLAGSIHHDMTFKCEYQVPEVIHVYNVSNTASHSLTWCHQQWKEGFIITMDVS